MRRDQGIALVVVLWVAMLLAGIAGAFVLETRAELTVARNNIDRAAARSLADGGIFAGAHELLKPPADRQFEADGTVYSIPVETGRLNIAIKEEAAKIDLNGAAAPLIKGLIEIVGLGESEAAALSDAILDWRDADDLTRLNGAEDREYRSAGRDYGARNDRFPTVADLANVLGVTPALLDLLAPHVTVDSGKRGIRLETASAEVLGAIPGATPEGVDDFLRARASGDAAIALAEFMSGNDARRYRARGISRAYTVRARAENADGAVFVREAVITLDLDDADGPSFAVRQWREGDNRGFETAANDDVPADDEAVR